MIRTATNATIELGTATTDTGIYALLHINDHGRRVTISLDDREIRELIGHCLTAWGQLHHN